MSKKFKITNKRLRNKAEQCYKYLSDLEVGTFMKYLILVLIVINILCSIWNLTDFLGPHNYVIAAYNFMVVISLIMCLFL